MKNKMLTLSLATTIFMLAACESAEKKTEKMLAETNATPMSAAEIRSNLIGNSFYSKFRTRKNSPAEYTSFYEDGTVRARVWGAGWEESDGGTWEATDENQYCRSWNTWRENQRACYELYKLSDDQIHFKLVSGNGGSSTETMSVGNTYDL